MADSITKKKTVRCPFCTQKVGTHPSGAMVPHYTKRRPVIGAEECHGSRKKA